MLGKAEQIHWILITKHNTMVDLSIFTSLQLKLTIILVERF